MKFGIVLPSYGPQAGKSAIIEAALAAESLGYESIWATDHLALPDSDADRFGTIFESITTLAYLAASTRTIRLGISALILPQRNPIEVAKQLANIDVLSDGRVIVALGIGWSQGEYRNLGYSFHNRGRRLNEDIQVLRTLWQGGSSVSFQGEFTSFENIRFSPPTTQPGGPPILVAGNSPAALQRAVRLADGWHPDGMPLEDFSNALAQARPFLHNRPFPVNMRMRVAQQAAYLSGTPAEMIGRLQKLQNAGLTHAVLSFQAETTAHLHQSMQTFASEVFPVFA